jgi:GNAT superfamily N-acetyltransferase
MTPEGKSLAIARAGPEDSEELTAIAHASKRHWGYPETWIVAWRDYLSVSPENLAKHHGYAAYSGGRKIGWYGLEVAGSEATLHHLWVLPSWIGHGFGRALFEHAEGLARGLGATRLRLEGDPNAEGFYRRMGMVRYEAVPASMDGVERIRPMMEKSLMASA